MRKTLPTLLAMFVAAFIISSCHKDDDGEDCTLDLSTTAGADGLVVYSVTVQSGTGTASSITYRADTQDVTVNNPTLPFHVTIDKKKGETISMTAHVHVDGGEVMASYSFSDPDGIDPEVGARSCKD